LIGHANGITALFNVFVSGRMLMEFSRCWQPSCTSVISSSKQMMKQMESAFLTKTLSKWVCNLLSNFCSTNT